jgi:hypothetical protein
MTYLINPKVRQDNIVTQESNGELLIYDLMLHKTYCLNQTSAMVYQLCDGDNSVSAIRESVAHKLKQPVPEDLVWLALDELKRNNLLADSNEIEINFNGLSRREMIRKVGLASMITLPIIYSLIAPTAAIAQSVGSCRTIGESCNPRNSLGNCCSGSGYCQALGVCSSCEPPTSHLGCATSTGCTNAAYRCCSGSASLMSEPACGAFQDCVCN